MNQHPRAAVHHKSRSITSQEQAEQEKVRMNLQPEQPTQAERREPSPTRRSSTPQLLEERQMKEQQDPHNTVTIYGCLRIRGVRHLIATCSRYGVPLRFLSVLSITRRGYRSHQYDSRRFVIRLATTSDTQVLHRSLNHIEQHYPELQHWRHTLTNTKATPGQDAPYMMGRSHPLSHHALISTNPFAVLAQEEENCSITEENIRVCCWNVNTTKGKETSIQDFLQQNSIHILGVTETSGDADCLTAAVVGYTWFGRAKSRHAGGVGFLVETRLLTDTRVETNKGKTPDTLFLKLTPENSRTTVFMLVYGKAAAGREISRKQWEGYQSDLRRELRRSPRDADVVFLGDINARVGRATTPVEEESISTQGEQVRNTSGEDALAFLQSADLVCLNNREPNQAVPQFTYRAKGQQGRSVIDVICVSRGMYRATSRASVLQETLTTHESHFPVVTSLRWYRRRSRVRRDPANWIWKKRSKMRRQERSFSKRTHTCLARVLSAKTLTKVPQIYRVSSSKARSSQFVACESEGANEGLGRSDDWQDERRS